MDLVRAYIQYLRDVSRKIISRSGFENVLPKETRKRTNYFFSLTTPSPGELPFQEALIKRDEFVVPTIRPDITDYLKSVSQFLQVNQDFRLFLGIGLINGDLNGSTVSAPLMTAIVEIDDEDGGITVSLDRDSLQLNYDIIAKFLNIRVDEEGDDVSISANDLEKLQAIDEIDTQLASYRSLDQLDARKMLEKLQNKIDALKQIQFHKGYSFNYKSRFQEFFSQLSFFNEWFFFVHKVPDELSTYEALNSLLKQDQLQNGLLQNLFNSILLDRPNTFTSDSEISSEQLERAISKIPLSLSQRQIEAIKRIWTTKISYIEGPPGTGKSHTICAIMILAAILGKKVLLVSQKKAAVDIVKSKVDSLLGHNALINVGSKDKTLTKSYLQDIYNKSGSRTSIKRDRQRIQELFQQFEDIESDIKRTQDQIVQDLVIENEYFRAHSTYKEKRDLFIQQYDHDLRNYVFYEKKLNHDNGLKSIDKYYKISQKGKKTRLEVIYQKKLLKLFVQLFKAELFLAKTDISYLKSIFEINYFYSHGVELLSRINKERLSRYRKQMKSLKEKKESALKSLLPLDFLNSLLYRASQDDDSRAAINKYNSSLRWKAPHRIQQSWQSLNFELLTQIFPIWCCELRSLGTVFPMIAEVFDVIIVDEASQVNIAELIPAFYRGKRFCIVGDDKQLHLNSTGVGFSLSKSFDSLCWNKNKIPELGVRLDEAKKRNLVVSEASILKFVNVQSSGITQTNLDEHYRSLPQLAHFNSKSFYQDDWKIMTENADNIQKVCFKAIKVQGQREEHQKYIKAEILKVRELLYSIIRTPGYNDIQELKPFSFDKPPSVGILSILSNQRDKINELIDESDLSDSEIENFDIMVGTPEDFQGNERDIMIITVGLDESTKWGRAHYENPNRFNVATSRAKYFTYFVYAGIPKTAARLRKYLNHFRVELKPEDEIENTSSLKWTFDPEFYRHKHKLDPNKFESTFESYVCEYLLKYINVRANIIIYNQVHACGQKRLDFVLYNRVTKATCAVEVDGSDHFVPDTHTYTEAHLDRIGILTRAGWKIVHTKYFNWYSNGWFCEKDVPEFTQELKRLSAELDEHLM